LSCDASGIDEHHQATIKPTYCRKNATFLVTIAGEKIRHLNGQGNKLIEFATVNTTTCPIEHAGTELMSRASTRMDSTASLTSLKKAR
jgi:hypothetical protein